MLDLIQGIVLALLGGAIILLENRTRKLEKTLHREKRKLKDKITKLQLKEADRSGRLYGDEPLQSYTGTVAPDQDEDVVKENASLSVDEAGTPAINDWPPEEQIHNY